MRVNALCIPQSHSPFPNRGQQCSQIAWRHVHRKPSQWRPTRTPVTVFCILTSIEIVGGISFPIWFESSERHQSDSVSARLFLLCLSVVLLTCFAQLFVGPSVHLQPPLLNLCCFYVDTCEISKTRKIHASPFHNDFDFILWMWALLCWKCIYCMNFNYVLCFFDEAEHMLTRVKVRLLGRK